MNNDNDYVYIDCQFYGFYIKRCNLKNYNINERTIKEINERTIKEIKEKKLKEKKLKELKEKELNERIVIKPKVCKFSSILPYFNYKKLVENLYKIIYYINIISYSY